MRNWIGVGVAVLSLMAVCSVASATPLPPGGIVVPDTSAETGTLVTSVSDSFSGKTSGSITEGVYSESGGTLDFVYQISVTTGQLGRLTVTNYAGVDLVTPTNGVSMTTTVPSGGIFSTPSAGGAATSADRSTIAVDGGNVVGFNWNPELGATANTWILIIRTPAKSDASNLMNLIDGTVFQFTGLGPATVPEPNSLLLLAGIVPGLGWLAYRRR
jgi:hypothetical protein